MAKAQTFTQNQLELARAKLESLPDLRPERIPASDVLSELKSQIVKLATEKGYSATDIKKVLDDLGIVVPAKSVKEILAAAQKPARRSSKKPSAPDPATSV